MTALTQLPGVGIQSRHLFKCREQTGRFAGREEHTPLAVVVETTPRLADDLLLFDHDGIDGVRLRLLRTGLRFCQTLSDVHPFRDAPDDREIAGEVRLG